MEKCDGVMNGSFAPGTDGLPGNFLNSNIKSLVAPLKHVINLSISSCTFPKKFKTAIVTPVYKYNSKSDGNN